PPAQAPTPTAPPATTTAAVDPEPCGDPSHRQSVRDLGRSSSSTPSTHRRASWAGPPGPHRPLCSVAREGARLFLHGETYGVGVDVVELPLALPFGLHPAQVQRHLVVDLVGVPAQF